MHTSVSRANNNLLTWASRALFSVDSLTQAQTIESICPNRVVPHEWINFSNTSKKRFCAESMPVFKPATNSKIMSCIMTSAKSGRFAQCCTIYSTISDTAATSMGVLSSLTRHWLRKLSKCEYSGIISQARFFANIFNIDWPSFQKAASRLFLSF